MYSPVRTAHADEQTSRPFLFTSESCGEGHSDRLCDQISDAILDAYVREDPEASVNCSVVAKSGMFMVLGQVTSKSHVDIASITRNVVRLVGYDSSDKWLDYRCISVMLSVDFREPHEPDHMNRRMLDQQGVFYGYATNETSEMLPLTTVLAHRINEILRMARERKELPWLGPDTTSQVTVQYVTRDGGVIPQHVRAILVSAQQYERTEILVGRLSGETESHLLILNQVNPSGPFTIGGPKGDAGLTGRKVIADSYGGWGSHGGHRVSGKDASYMERAVSYYARWICKSLVAAQLAKRCLLQLTYVSGIELPTAMHSNCYGSSQKTETELLSIVEREFKLRHRDMVDILHLHRPIFRAACRSHHYMDQMAPWEHPKELRGESD
ncbi:S-adenosylmethionine synthase isoform type-2 [Elasticomyces elasticus]|uniref:S-adenosylmethionine synthase n=1 Tax=Elasticomyces elasticus TaxID=574655 RepID=A0AAN7W091_9PEZI|nr:S-adenosylmethionine synthase isoform type-2 [Elasticomyces elasticus]